MFRRVCAAAIVAVMLLCMLSGCIFGGKPTDVVTPDNQGADNTDNTDNSGNDTSGSAGDAGNNASGNVSEDGNDSSNTDGGNREENTTVYETPRIPIN